MSKPIEYTEEKRLNEIEINFTGINELIIYNNPESLMIKRCPSMSCVINSLSTILDMNLLSINSMNFKINERLKELNEIDFLKLAMFFKKFQRFFIVSFVSVVDNTNQIYWRTKDSFQIFSLHIETNSCGLSDFVKKFLIKSLKEDHDGNFFNKKKN